MLIILPNHSSKTYFSKYLEKYLVFSTFPIFSTSGTLDLIR